MSEHKDTCGFALYGPPAICTCKTAPKQEGPARDENRVFNPGGEKFLIAALEKIAAMPPRLLPSQLIDQFIEMRMLAKRAIAYATTPLDCKSASGTPLPHQFLDRSGCCAMCGLAKADYLGEAEYGGVSANVEIASDSEIGPARDSVSAAERAAVEWLDRAIRNCIPDIAEYARTIKAMLERRSPPCAGTARDSVLEEAAKVADDYAAKTPDNSLRIGAGWIAADIRSLKSSSPPCAGTGVEITPAMLKAAWVEVRKWWPLKVVEFHDCNACKQTKGLRVVETCIRVDEPQPGFREAIRAALSTGVGR